MVEDRASQRSRTWSFLLWACLLSLMTVALQVRALGLPFLETGEQLARHRAVLEGTSIDPWQYRILSDYMVEWMVALGERLNLPHHLAIVFVVFRALQNFMIFQLAAIYYLRLGLGADRTLLGLACLAWGMTHCNYNSDLQFSTYSDVIFYLLAALAVLQEKLFWIPPIAALAGLNRETSLLIPFLLPVKRLWRPGGRLERSTVIIAGSSLILCAGFVLGLRYLYGPRPTGLSTPPVGMVMLLYNLRRYQSWVFLFATMGPLPFMAVSSFSRWPHVLRGWFWALVPIWLVVHFFASIVAEARLFLVPHTLIFIPGALLGLSIVSKEETGIA